MSIYILMKILESAPSRYDRGIRILTFGSVDKIYDRMCNYINKGQKVLDIGCGTGALTLRAAMRGARVKGIDINPHMLEIALKRASELGLTHNIILSEMGAAELGIEESESYDIVTSSLCFSELTDDETNYTLKEIKRILKPEGFLLIADEVRPKRILESVLYWMIRLPLLIITYIITQTTTHAVVNLPDRIEKTGFEIQSISFSNIGSFLELICKNPKSK